jgi:hypothetical protein
MLNKPYPVNKDDKPEDWTTDTYAYFDVYPKSRNIVGRHYYCAWSSTLAQVYKLAAHIGG